MKNSLPIIVAIIVPILLVAAIILVGAIKSQPNPTTQANLSSYASNNKIENVNPPKSATASAQASSSALAQTQPTSDNTPMDSPPAMQIDQNKTYVATLKTTAGTIELSLNAKATPITVNNFVFLARKNFYDNTIFHRVIKGFMIQGGDPKGDGTGGPGYKFNDEPFTGDYTRGTVAMANAGPNTNGSQFFIMHQTTPLSHDYVIFGHVTSGMDVVDKIATAPTKPGGEGSTPVDPVKITSIAIAEH